MQIGFEDDSAVEQMQEIDWFNWSINLIKIKLQLRSWWSLTLMTQTTRVKKIMMLNQEIFSPTKGYQIYMIPCKEGNQKLGSKELKKWGIGSLKRNEILQKKDSKKECNSLKGKASWLEESKYLNLQISKSFNFTELFAHS